MFVNYTDLKNATSITLSGNKIPVFILPQGCVRFSTLKCNSENPIFIVSISDKKIDDISKDRTYNELWQNQTVNPLFAIRFESVEQIEAYIKGLSYFLERVKSPKN